MPRYFCVLFAVVLLAGLLPLLALADTAPIEQEQPYKLQAEGEADFFVKLAADADLSTALDIADWNARGA